MRGSQRAFCSGVPCASSVGPDEVHADAADELRRPGAGELLGDDVVLDRTAAAPAVLLRPRDADEPTARELRLPRAPERDLVGEVVEARRQALAVLPREVRAQPVAHLVAQCGFRGSRAQVHDARKLPQRQTRWSIGTYLRSTGPV